MRTETDSNTHIWVFRAQIRGSKSLGLSLVIMYCIHCVMGVMAEYVYKKLEAAELRREHIPFVSGLRLQSEILNPPLELTRIFAINRNILQVLCVTAKRDH